SLRFQWLSDTTEGIQGVLREILMRSWVRYFGLLAIVVACSALANPMFGQARDTASLFGTVSDAQGAIIPGAQVTLTNTATGQARTIETDATGGFVFPLLPVGTY